MATFSSSLWETLKRKRALGHYTKTVEVFRELQTGRRLDIYERQAEGHANAQFSLASMYDQGRGVSRDGKREQAATWYSRAADQGHVVAQFMLGEMYENGRGALAE